MSTIAKALDFATKAHDGQVRKYTGLPYITHPINVANLVAKYFDSEELYIAALLHDVVEDTSYTIQDIEKEFGHRVAMLVSDLTDISKPEDGNRAIRKAIDRKHTLAGCFSAKNIKLCDLIDNCQSIVTHDKGFAKVYLKEFKLLLDGLYGNTYIPLWFDANNIYYSAIEELDKS